MPVQLEGSIAIDLKACKLIANSALPYSTPNEFSIVDPNGIIAASVISVIAASLPAAPDEISSISSSPISAPAIKTPVIAASIAAPLVVSGVAASSVVAPNVVAPKSHSDMPPFPLSNPRILYQSVLGDSTSAGGGVNRLGMLNPSTWDRWTFTASSGATLVAEFTLPSNQSVDCAAIAAHNIADIGANVRLDYSTTTGGAWVEFASSASPINNNAIMVFLESPISVRRIRVRISGGSGSGYIGVLSAGLALQMQHPIYGGVNPITLNRVTDYFNNRSESGEWLGRQIRRRGLQSSVSFDRLTAPWYRQYFDPFVRAAREAPFFFAWRPSDYPAEVAYCWTDGDISPSNSGGGTDHISVSIDLEAHG